MKNNIQDALNSVIKGALKELFPQADAPLEPNLDLPTGSSFGDLTTNLALRLCKGIKKSPRETATILAEAINKHLQKDPAGKFIKEVKVEGAGFINFYFSENFFYAKLEELLSEGKQALKEDFGAKQPVLIEFVSANPTGSLSVAHARQAAVGDSLASIMNFLGFRAEREYYLNDEGNQINILGKSVELRMRELDGIKEEFPENYYQGDYIYDIAKEAKAKKIKQEELGDFAAGIILDVIKKELADFGVEFDHWSSQKALTKSGKIEEAFKFLKAKGYLYEQDGATWFKSTEFGDDKDRVVVKSDGSQTYLAPDIAYHQEKFKRGFSWLINLWGPDHHGYINRLKASVEAFGHKSESISIIIVQLATIFRAGQVVQMSTRKGQYITLREVLDEVGKDAARFFFLMRRTSSHLDFDLEVAKKETAENPIFYVQYAHARICSILRSSPAAVKFSQANLSLLKEKAELDLLKKLVQFSYILHICLSTLDPYMLTVYLQELGQTFHKFYDQHRVLGEDRELTQARLALAEGTRIVLACGLELLGVSQPEKM
ncbi:MAG: arginine--tRNA ligase [Candidatus Omnitrophica bacterium]|nr:arginine--tRNA ligase [Candidatus Omnitrophota bacterium]MDD5652739.1 arginine--tRNA ligase [Candidatus Omnitrophota bacterium]